jgi:gliding motility-associated-like protein
MVVVSVNLMEKISSNPSSGNKITIDWKDTPAGNYQLRVEETNSFGCSSSSTMTVQILPNSIVNLQNVIVCVDAANNWTSVPVLATNLSSSQFTFKWFLNGNLLPDTTSSLLPKELGIYKVIVTSKANGCTTEDSATVSSSLPIVAFANTINDFASTQTVVVTASGGTPQYMYSLDGASPQSSNEFFVTDSGKHIITVTDQTNCNVAQVCAFTFQYDKFFTPNGDGFHDTWNIVVPNNTSVMSISIFDRYGKLLKKYNPRQDRWDGIYNGSTVFATDYWFVLDYIDCLGENKQFKSHFSLKR